MNTSGGKQSDHILYFTNNEFQKAQISTLFRTGLIIPRLHTAILQLLEKQY